MLGGAIVNVRRKACLFFLCVVPVLSSGVKPSRAVGSVTLGPVPEGRAAPPWWFQFIEKVFRLQHPRRRVVHVICGDAGECSVTGVG